MVLPLYIAPSVLAADFAHLADAVRDLARAGADWIHLDVMDGQFVPNLTFGPPIIKSIRNLIDLPFDTHLMVREPARLFPMFVDAGCSRLTIHPTACTDPVATLRAVAACGCAGGVAFNPDDSLDDLEQYLPHVDLVLVMTVNAGFGGQKFQPVYDRIADVRRRVDLTGRSIHVQVDGGITPENAPDVIAAGANVVVAGTSVFARGAEFYAESIAALRGKFPRPSPSSASVL